MKHECNVLHWVLFRSNRGVEYKCMGHFQIMHLLKKESIHVLFSFHFITLQYAMLLCLIKTYWRLWSQLDKLWKRPNCINTLALKEQIDLNCRSLIKCCFWATNGHLNYKILFCRPKFLTCTSASKILQLINSDLFYWLQHRKWVAQFLFPGPRKRKI